MKKIILLSALLVPFAACAAEQPQPAYYENGHPVYATTPPQEPKESKESVAKRTNYDLNKKDDKKSVMQDSQDQIYRRNE